MNIYHHILLLLQLIGFLVNLHKNGEQKPERDLKYNAVYSFYGLVVCYVLVFLSAYK